MFLVETYRLPSFEVIFNQPLYTADYLKLYTFDRLSLAQRMASILEEGKNGVVMNQLLTSAKNRKLGHPYPERTQCIKEQ